MYMTYNSLWSTYACLLTYIYTLGNLCLQKPHVENVINVKQFTPVLKWLMLASIVHMPIYTTLLNYCLINVNALIKDKCLDILTYVECKRLSRGLADYCIGLGTFLLMIYIQEYSYVTTFSAKNICRSDYLEEYDAEKKFLHVS